MRVTLKGGGRREDQVDRGFGTRRQLYKEGRRNRRVETHADSPFFLQLIEVEVLSAGDDFAGVVEERQVEVTVDHDAPLRLQQQAVQIAEPPAAVRAQRGPSADRGQHEEGDLLI